MIEGDEWQIGEAPTPQDILKFKASGARLLIQTPWYATPYEIRIADTVNGGEAFRAGNNSAFSYESGQWYVTRDIRIIAILPPPAPPPKPQMVAASSPGNPTNFGSIASQLQSDPAIDPIALISALSADWFQPRKPKWWQFWKRR